MSDSHSLDIDDTAQPVIERAPEVELLVRYDGSAKSVSLKPGEYSTIDFNGFNVAVEVVKVNRPKPVPVMGPPYRFLIQCTDGYERVIRSMEESLAVKHFHRTENVEREILDVFPITHLTS